MRLYHYHVLLLVFLPRVLSWELPLTGDRHWSRAKKTYWRPSNGTHFRPLKPPTQKTSTKKNPLPKYWQPQQGLNYARKRDDETQKQMQKLSVVHLRYNGAVPRQPSPYLRTNITYDIPHRLFHIKSASNLHIRAAPHRKKGSPWPMPKVYNEHPKARYWINQASFGVHVRKLYNDVLDFNLKRFWSHVFQLDYTVSTHCFNHSIIKNILETPQSEGVKKRELVFLEINIQNKSTHYPTASMNESYLFRIRSDNVLQLDCRQVWGAIRGLETLSQLIQEDKNQLFIPDVEVVDAPRFPHRGLMIDTARHFIRKEFLLENLEAMVQNKLNVFHWHMTDDQSFPFQSLVFPNLTKYGAFHETLIYTHSDIAEIIEAARLRGIRVIPEFDVPGHTFAWGYGQPDLLTPCFSSKGELQFFGPMNPTKDKTYEILKKLFEEILQVFPENSVHIGGDEVDRQCWHSNPDYMYYMMANNTSTPSILAGFNTRLQKDIMEAASRRNVTRNPGKYGEDPFQMFAWQEAFDEKRNLTKNTVVQMWKNSEDHIRKMTQKGYKVIYSTCWYLDHVQYGIDWDYFYNCLDRMKSDPSNFGGLLIGGEVCMWTEYVDDISLMPRLWPRASAAAERLWSSSDQTDIETAGRRIEEQNCRMKNRGINSGVLSGPGFCEFKGTKFHQNEEVNVFSGRNLETLRMQNYQGPWLYLPLGILLAICLFLIARARALCQQGQYDHKSPVCTFISPVRLLRLKKRNAMLVLVTVAVFMLIADIMRLSASPTTRSVNT